MRILIIDDDLTTTHALTHYLQTKGHATTIASDSQTAIKTASRDFDLIISDVMMPGISGLSLVNLLRTIHLCNTPILLMSSLVNKSLQEAALSAGANDFLSKPLDPEELNEKLERFGSTNDKS
jgi:DNA-binding response OmpR family regulator